MQQPGSTLAPRGIDDEQVVLCGVSLATGVDPSISELATSAIRGARFVRAPGRHHGDLFQRARDELLRECARFAG